MKGPDTVVLPLVRKEDILKSLPDPLSITLAPRRDINIPDMVDSNQSCTKIVEAEATLDDVGPLLYVFNLQGYTKPAKTSL